MPSPSPESGQNTDLLPSTAPDIISGDPPLIALTFDDGPSPTTELVLDVLEKYGVPATFFVLGSLINETTAPTMRRAFGMGCEFGNHGWSHTNMAGLPAETILWEVTRTSDRIEWAVGIRPKYFRPPYLSVSRTVFNTVGLPFISGVGPHDWTNEVSAETRARQILEQSEDGVIFLLHDFYKNYPTVEALEAVIPELLDRGFRFVTLSELFELKGVKPEAYNGTFYISPAELYTPALR
jgi:peptidoglycan/xylan/chitin deacetylase (PgdA/CDA1 family)